MAKSILEPAKDMVLVIDSSREVTLDGIILPDNMRQQEMIFGTVIFVGPDVSPRTQIQNRVAYGPYAGKTVILDGIEFRGIREGQIEFYVRQKEE